MKDRVAYVRMSADEHERLAAFAAQRSISAAEAAREILRERLETPLLRTPPATRAAAVSRLRRV